MVGRSGADGYLRPPRRGHRRLGPHHDPLAAGAIYWDFVDVVWLCLFTTFYLLTPR